MNEQWFVVSDVLWQRLEPYLPGKASDAGAKAKDNRLFLEAVFWRVRTGSPWRDLPPAFGRWNSQFRRFRRWARCMAHRNHEEVDDETYTWNTQKPWRKDRQGHQAGDPQAVFI